MHLSLIISLGTVGLVSETEGDTKPGVTSLDRLTLCNLSLRLDISIYVSEIFLIIICKVSNEPERSFIELYSKLSDQCTVTLERLLKHF